MAAREQQKTTRVHFSLGLTAVFAVGLEGMLIFRTLQRVSYDVAKVDWGRQLLMDDASLLAPSAIAIFIAGWSAYTWTHPIRGKIARTVTLTLLIPCLAVVLPALTGAFLIGPHLFPIAITWIVQYFGAVCFAAAAVWSIYFAASHATFPPPMDWVEKRRKA